MGSKRDLGTHYVVNICELFTCEAKVSDNDNDSDSDNDESESQSDNDIYDVNIFHYSFN